MKIAKDVMNSEVITVNKDTDFKEILELMQKKSIGKIPVIDNGEVIGVVTRDDLLAKEEEAPLPPMIAFWDILITLQSSKAFEEKLMKLSGYTASAIMTKKFLKVGIDDRLDKIVTNIIEAKYDFAIVFDNDDKLCGIITKTDLIKNSF